MAQALTANFPKKKILLVDDDDLWRETLADFLSERWEIVQCANGRIAVDYLSRHREAISLVVSDFNMPVMSGDKLLQWMMNENLRLPMVFITGRAEILLENPSVLKSQATVLQKPIELDDIETVISNKLRHRAA